MTIGHDALHSAVGPGLLDTGQPLSAAAVRRLACDATILPVVLGSTSVPVDVGRAERVWTRERRAAVVVRDRGCAFPGCDRPASFCQVHHIVHWVDGGTTSLDNGVLLCRTHHRLVPRGDWAVRLGTDRLPEFLPPRHLDPDRQPRRNVYHLRN